MSGASNSAGQPRKLENAPVFHARGITPQTRVVVVASGKGGVGKSTVAVNLAVTLAKSHSVGILDADIYGFSVPSMIGALKPPRVENVHDLVPPVAHGVKVMSMGYFLEEDRALMWRGPMLGKALRQMLTDVHWNNPEFLIIDTPPGTGDVAMTVDELFSNTQTLVVTTPQIAARRVAIRSGAMAQETGRQLLGIVENMTDPDELFGSGGGHSIAEQLGVPLLGQIPLSKQLRDSVDCGVPACRNGNVTEVGTAFDLLAKEVVATQPTKRYRKELKVQ